MQTSDSGERVLSSDTLHIFTNNYSFINLEEKYLSTGGAFGSRSFYLWKLFVPTEKEDDKATEEEQTKAKDLHSQWRLVGVVTRHSGSKPSYSADLGSSFKSLDNQQLTSEEYLSKFRQPECEEGV